MEEEDALAGNAFAGGALAHDEHSQDAGSKVSGQQQVFSFWKQAFWAAEGSGNAILSAKWACLLKKGKKIENVSGFEIPESHSTSVNSGITTKFFFSRRDSGNSDSGISGNSGNITKFRKQSGQLPEELSVPRTSGNETYPSKLP